MQWEDLRHMCNLYNNNDPKLYEFIKDHLNEVENSVEVEILMNCIVLTPCVIKKNKEILEIILEHIKKLQSKLKITTNFRISYLETLLTTSDLIV